MRSFNSGLFLWGTFMKIAIVGMSPFTEEIPEDFEVWVIALYISHFTRYDKAFECHEQPPTEGSAADFINDPWVPLFVPEHLIHIYPKAIPMQTEHMAKKYHRSFGSTISYMLAQAIYEKPEEIALFGVRLDSKDEYVQQKPSAYFWLGVANGLGIKTSGLLIEETYGLKENIDVD